MTNFALVNSVGNLVRYQFFPASSAPAILSVEKGLRWVAASPPVYDPPTQYPPAPVFPVPADAIAVQYTVADKTIAVVIAEMQANLLSQVNSLCDQQMEVVKAGYPESEGKTWDQQLREAELYQANPSLATPLLSSMSSMRGLPVAEFASRIIANAATYATMAGLIVGRRQKLEDDIAAITTVAEAEAVTAIIATGWPV